MSQDSDFFDQRAKAAWALAETADLANVRVRELRSAAAWQAMADRARRIEKSRRQSALERERLKEQMLQDEEATQVAGKGTSDGHE